MELDILVVDDEEFILEILRDKLKQFHLPIKLHLAGNALDAKRVLEDGSMVPGLVLVDLLMPLLNGLELVRMLKGNPRTAHVPVVVITGSYDPEIIEKARRAGAREILHKPLDKHAYARLREILQDELVQGLLDSDAD